MRKHILTTVLYKRIAHDLINQLVVKILCVLKNNNIRRKKRKEKKIGVPWPGPAILKSQGT
jgi:hypothetical protein